MDGLDDFMAFRSAFGRFAACLQKNFCEDAREEQERSQTTEYPYQKQYWEEEKKSDNYWDEDSSSSEEN